MGTGYLVGYVGGLAVALGVGAAVMVSAPTASADTAAGPSSHGASPGTAKSARAPQRATAVVSKKSAPKRTVDAPASSVTLLMAASGAAETRRKATSTTPPADAVPIDDSTNLVIDSDGVTTRISLRDNATGTQTGTTLVLTGRVAQPPLLDVAHGRAVIATSWEASNEYVSQVAVFDTQAGTQTGTTLDFTGSPAVSLVDDGLALIRTVRYDATTGGVTDFTVLDTASGTAVGDGLTLDGGLWNTPAVRVGNARLLVMSVDQNYWAGTATVSAAVLDIATGTQVGHPVSLDGAPWGDPILSRDGVHVLLTASIGGVTHAAVIDTAAGEQSGTTVDLQGTAGYVVTAADGIHVLITADDGYTTRIAVVDTTTGDQTGVPLAMTDRLERPLLSADGVHALVTASTADSTEVAVLDTVSGERTGTPVVLSGQVRGPLVNSDGIHALFASSTGNSTEVMVLDSRTGEQTGVVDVEGAMSYALVDADQTHVLVVTSVGGSTQFTSFDSANGQRVGAPLTFSGALTGWPYPTTAADGTHALFILDDADETRLVLIDITTGTQTGTGLVLPGEPGMPIVSDDGHHTTIYTRVPATHTHGSSTRVAVIDTTTGNQVGATTRLTGTPAALPQVSADGHHVGFRTFAGVSANLDTSTGAATTHIAGAPWGLDLEAFALTPLGRMVTAIQLAVNTAYLVMVQFVLLGFFMLGGVLSQAPSAQPAAPSGNATVAR